MAIEIPISRGMFAIIDEADAPLISSFKWSAKPGKKTFYAVRRMLVAEGHGRRLQSMHSLLTGWRLIDHANGNGLDNRRSNLREATDADNQHNVRKKPGSSRFKGVFFMRKTGRWQARITVNYKQTHLGQHASEEAAALAYDAAARVHFGAFATLNFPRPGERSALT